ncbi:MAG: hypothetical protein COA57_13760 [Flavobacteriales bacterium]|nr:MAG: hypothetical protein COA57_13760 [Flavobacteriales bacterium]
MTHYFLIPVYNEAANIELLHQNLTNVLEGEQKFYVFVDDCSSDDSIKILREKFAGTDFHIIEKEQNLGPGDSFNKGFNWISENSGNQNNIIITIEADNTSDLSILPKMIAISKLDYELVLASVYSQGGGFEKTNLFRKLISFAANMAFRLFFNINVQTLSSFYRVYHLSLIRKIKQHNAYIIREKGFICMLEILIKAIKENASIIEVPTVSKSGSRAGKSKMKIFKTTLSYLDFLIFRRG